MKSGLLNIQFSLVAQSCPTLWDPVDCSKPGIPVHQQLPEFTQTHVYWVADAIQLSHPLWSPSPPAPQSQYLLFLFRKKEKSVVSINYTELFSKWNKMCLDALWKPQSVMRVTLVGLRHYDSVGLPLLVEGVLFLLGPLPLGPQNSRRCYRHILAILWVWFQIISIKQIL